MCIRLGFVFLIYFNGIFSIPFNVKRILDWVIVMLFLNSKERNPISGISWLFSFIFCELANISDY